jgi:hypothetical protein
MYNAINEIINSGGGDQISILTQEWISPLFGGVVFTGNPASLSDSKKIYLDFQLYSSDAITSGASSSNLITLPFHELNNQNMIEEVFKKQFAPKLSDEPEIISQLIPKLMNFLRICADLDRQFQIPLDIEFICNSQFEFFFLQMRPIIYPS